MIKISDIPENADVIEIDDSGNIVGYGSDRDYDTHLEDVLNGNGYYDDEGHYRDYAVWDDD